MEFTIYRDFASLAFVRCVSRVSNCNIYAEGTGFSVAAAVEKCRSESIEAQFQLAHPLKFNMLGIAAHPEAESSLRNAWNEALETLALESLANAPAFFGISVRFLGVRLSLARLNDRFLAIALFSHRDAPTATQAVCTNPFRALLKAWSEVRNFRIYDPPVSELPAYTKVNRLLDDVRLSQIRVERSLRRNIVDTGRLKEHQARVGSHFITFFTKESTA